MYYTCSIASCGMIDYALHWCVADQDVIGLTLRWSTTSGLALQHLPISTLLDHAKVFLPLSRCIYNLYRWQYPCIEPLQSAVRLGLVQSLCNVHDTLLLHWYQLTYGRLENFLFLVISFFVCLAVIGAFTFGLFGFDLWHNRLALTALLYPWYWNSQVQTIDPQDKIKHTTLA